MPDERPRPKYGELAPEGWQWTPPAPPAGSDVPVPSGESTGRPADAEPRSADPRATGTSTDGRYGGPAAPYSGAPRPYSPAPHGRDGLTGTAAGQRPVRVGDVAFTALILFLGVLFSASMLPALFDFNTVLAQAAALQGYGTYTASAAASTAGVIAGVVTIMLQLGSIVVCVRRIAVRRLAFPFALIFGVATFLAWVVAISFAFFNDPSFAQQLMTRPTP
ncbi:DUF6264 family protein [Subtercola vilae]|uniref:Uncharacterized protein n=1 Tax=Subtercola vilae TaxID=2056433 RepID=A0A4T2C0E3_9MICO|nr:DUF6264 family protein [Subtercola vilae]TIH37149.1 hypothetical protein D4765_09045 [Subtercola vilae]